MAVVRQDRKRPEQPADMLWTDIAILVLQEIRPGRL